MIQLYWKIISWNNLDHCLRSHEIIYSLRSECARAKFAILSRRLEKNYFSSSVWLLVTSHKLCAGIQKSWLWGGGWVFFSKSRQNVDYKVPLRNYAHWIVHTQLPPIICSCSISSFWTDSFVIASVSTDIQDLYTSRCLKKKMFSIEVVFNNALHISLSLQDTVKTFLQWLL